MPSHAHTRGTMNIIGETRWISESAVWNGEACGAFRGFYSGGGSITNVYTYDTAARYAFKFNAADGWTGETSYEGSGTAQNNMQPYLSVYMWRRTA